MDYTETSDIDSKLPPIVKPKFILCLALVLSGLLTGCVTDSKLAKVRVNGEGDVITIAIRESGKLHHITFPKDVHMNVESDAVDVDEAILIDQQEKSGFRYLCFFTTGASRPGGNGLGWCGSGIESRMVWTKLKDWRIVDLRQQRVESCFEGVGLIEPGNWKDGIYTMIFSSPHGINTKVALEYNPAKPERGFILNTNFYNQ